MIERELAAWRRDQRHRLLDIRRMMPSGERHKRAEKLVGNLDSVFATIKGKTLGIYWPIKHEIDIRKWADALSDKENIGLALPVVDEPRQPLSYRVWHIGAPMTRGFWNIPIPTSTTVVEPDVVIAPLVGCWGMYRLGYGGGYFDRTLAARHPRPLAVGIGFEPFRLAQFTPQPHDIPMDVVVTDEAITDARRQEDTQGNNVAPTSKSVEQKHFR